MRTCHICDSTCLSCHFLHRTIYMYERSCTGSPFSSPSISEIFIGGDDCNLRKFCHLISSNGVRQWCTTSCPRATSGPRRVLVWPAVSNKKKNYFYFNP